MHVDLLSSLATERRRDLDALATARRARATCPARRPRPSIRRLPIRPVLLLPRYRLSWTRTTLAAVSGSRRGSSFVIVISATRTG